jgi:hypothetical protein
VDLFLLYLRGPRETFNRMRVAPTPILLICCITGSIVCIATIVDTLIFSFAPPLIPNSVWWYTVGGYAVICMFLCAIVGMVATSETDIEEWQLSNIPREP